MCVSHLWSLINVLIVLYHKRVYSIPCLLKHSSRHQIYHHCSKTREVIAYVGNQRSSWMPSWTQSWIFALCIHLFTLKLVYCIPCSLKHMTRYQNYYHWSKTLQVIAYIVNRRPYWTPSLISTYVFIVLPKNEFIGFLTPKAYD